MISLRFPTVFRQPPIDAVGYTHRLVCLLHATFLVRPDSALRISGGTTCAMVLGKWALLHEMRLMTTFDGLNEDRRQEQKHRKQGRRH